MESAKTNLIDLTGDSESDVDNDGTDDVVLVNQFTPWKRNKDATKGESILPFISHSTKTPRSAPKIVTVKKEKQQYTEDEQGRTASCVMSLFSSSSVDKDLSIDQSSPLLLSCSDTRKEIQKRDMNGKTLTSKRRKKSIASSKNDLPFSSREDDDDLNFPVYRDRREQRQIPTNVALRRTDPIISSLPTTPAKDVGVFPDATIAAHDISSRRSMKKKPPFGNKSPGKKEEVPFVDNYRFPGEQYINQKNNGSLIIIDGVEIDTNVAYSANRDESIAIERQAKLLFDANNAKKSHTTDSNKPVESATAFSAQAYFEAEPETEKRIYGDKEQSHFATTLKKAQLEPIAQHQPKSIWVHRSKRDHYESLANPTDRGLQVILWEVCKFKFNLLPYQLQGVRGIAGVEDDFPYRELPLLLTDKTQVNKILFLPKKRKGCGLLLADEMGKNHIVFFVDYVLISQFVFLTRRCSLQYGTGLGKTIMAIAGCMLRKAIGGWQKKPCLICVPNDSLVVEWAEKMVAAGIPSTFIRQNLMSVTPLHDEWGEYYLLVTKYEIQTHAKRQLESSNMPEHKRKANVLFRGIKLPLFQFCQQKRREAKKVDIHDIARTISDRFRIAFAEQKWKTYDTVIFDEAVSVIMTSLSYKDTFHTHTVFLYIFFNLFSMNTEIQSPSGLSELVSVALILKE